MSRPEVPVRLFISTLSAHVGDLEWEVADASQRGDLRSFQPLSGARKKVVPPTRGRSFGVPRLRSGGDDDPGTKVSKSRINPGGTNSSQWKRRPGRRWEVRDGTAHRAGGARKRNFSPIVPTGWRRRGQPRRAAPKFEEKVSNTPPRHVSTGVRR